MADDKTAKTTDTVETAPSSGGGNKLGSLLAAFNLLLTLGIGAVVFIQFQKDKHKEAVSDIQPEAPEAGHGEAAKEGEHGGGHGEAAKEGGHGEAAKEGEHGGGHGEAATIVMTLVFAITFAFLLAGGLFLSVVGGVEWFDGTASTPHLLYAGLCLSSACFFLLSILFSKKNWVVSEEARRILYDKPQVAPLRTPVEDLIQLFVSEYTKESNKPSRAQATAPAQPSPAATPAPPAPGSENPNR